MLAAIVKLDGHAPGLNILPDVISGIEDAAGADIFPAPGFGAILMLCNDLCPAGAKRESLSWHLEVNSSLWIVVLIGQYIQQRGESAAFSSCRYVPLISVLPWLSERFWSSRGNPPYSMVNSI